MASCSAPRPAITGCTIRHSMRSAKKDWRQRLLIRRKWRAFTFLDSSLIGIGYTITDREKNAYFFDLRMLRRSPCAHNLHAALGNDQHSSSINAFAQRVRPSIDPSNAKDFLCCVLPSDFFKIHGIDCGHFRVGYHPASASATTFFFTRAG